MTNSHPITPSPFQLDQWESEARATTDPSLLNEPAIRAGRFGVVHRKALCLAFAAGADQELDACCEWLVVNSWKTLDSRLRAARRPKPPSLKEQALHALLHMDQGQHNERTLIIRSALEQLPD